MVDNAQKPARSAGCSGSSGGSSGSGGSGSGVFPFLTGRRFPPDQTIVFSLNGIILGFFFLIFLFIIVLGCPPNPPIFIMRVFL